MATEAARSNGSPHVPGGMIRFQDFQALRVPPDG